MTTDKNQNYSADSIQALEGMEHVRKRPSMYIGDVGVRGLHHLVYEVVDNSIDEAMAGHASLIKVTLNTDLSVEIEDNGRGMPIDLHPEEKIPGVELILTRLHAGSKFNNNTYQFSGGLHGVGVSVVNALSSRLEVNIKRDGKIYHMLFKEGIKQQDLEIKGTCLKRETGTHIQFWPDPQYFDSVKFSLSSLRRK